MWYTESNDIQQLDTPAPKNHHTTITRRIKTLISACGLGYLKNNSGNLALATAIVAPILFVGATAAVDITKVYRSNSRLQDTVDAAVLAAAREVFYNNASYQKANTVAHSTMDKILNGEGAYRCDKLKKSANHVSMKCYDKIDTLFSFAVKRDKINFEAFSEASIGDNLKVEVSFAYDISDSMLNNNKLRTLERAMQSLMKADLFVNKKYDTHFSLIPYANSVAFPSSFENWVDPKSGYTYTANFNGCFMPEATALNHFLSAPKDLTAAPEQTNKDGRTFCPVPKMAAQFYMHNPRNASHMISNIQTSTGTASNEGLIWAYRSLHPDMKGVFTPNTKFPRDFSKNHKKILIFLTDGRPKNKDWEKRADSDVHTKSEQNFINACNKIKSDKNNIDVYMIGFGNFSRGKDLKPLLQDCIKGNGRLILADNTSLLDELLKITYQRLDIALTR